MIDDPATLDAAVELWSERGWPRPRVHLVTGSGLAIQLPGELLAEAPLAELVGLELAAVEGHDLTLQLLRLDGGRLVLYQRGRLHAYQGYSPFETVFPVRLGARLGARVLVMTNAAGGLRSELPAGSLVVLRDHLNLTGLNPLRGRLPSSWGPSFPDLTHAYDSALRRLAREVAAEQDLELVPGVYAGLLGPSYETPAEVRMLRRLGADVVGMSTVLEVIAAHHMGSRCLCLSVVTNPAAGVAEEPLQHEDVLALGEAAAPRVRALLESLLVHPELLA